LLARELDKAAHIGLPAAFLAINVVAFAVLAFCIAALLEVSGVVPWLGLVLLLTPLPLEFLLSAYMPDLFHAALTALFFLLLLKDRLGLALVVLLISFA